MGFRVPEPELQSLRIAERFNGKKLINCATANLICLANQAGQPQFLLPPSGQITRVPKRILRWRTIDEGVPVTDTEYYTPVDLPDGSVVAVISEEVYHDLHTWNANCGDFELIDLSWMVVLGPLVEGFTNCYRGLIIPPEAKHNPELIPESFQNDSLADIARFMVPEV